MRVQKHVLTEYYSNPHRLTPHSAMRRITLLACSAVAMIFWLVILQMVSVPSAHAQPVETGVGFSTGDQSGGYLLLGADITHDRQAPTPGTLYAAQPFSSAYYSVLAAPPYPSISWVTDGALIVLQESISNDINTSQGVVGGLRMPDTSTFVLLAERDVIWHTLFLSVSAPTTLSFTSDVGSSTVQVGTNTPQTIAIPLVYMSGSVELYLYGDNLSFSVQSNPIGSEAVLTGITYAVSAIPEPASMFFMALGLLCVLTLIGRLKRPT